jgi:hypothetical protein
VRAARRVRRAGRGNPPGAILAGRPGPTPTLLKQSDRWNIRQLPDGRRIWTTPTGLEYTSHLHDYAD